MGVDKLIYPAGQELNLDVKVKNNTYRVLSSVRGSNIFVGMLAMDEWLISLQTINKKARNYAYLVSQLTIKPIRRQAQPQKKVQDAQTAIESQIFSKQTMCSLCLQNLPCIKIVLKIIGRVWVGYIYLQQFRLI